jgi:hypothetical protein
MHWRRCRVVRQPQRDSSSRVDADDFVQAQDEELAAFLEVL